MLHHMPHAQRVVPIDQPDFHGQMVEVATLPGTPQPQTLRGLINGNQLAVSGCGLYVGQVLARSRTTEMVVHSAFGPMESVFLRDASGQGGARILRVATAHLLVWGRVEGHPPGVWLMSAGGSRLLHRLDRLLAPSGGVFRGMSADYPEQIVHLMPWGIWPVAQDGIVMPDATGLCVVERFGGVLHAYAVSDEGVTRFSCLTLEPGERTAGICRWQDRLMLAVSRGTQSWLVELGAAQGQLPARLPIDGDLHWLWSSPRGKTLAMFVHPRGADRDVRRVMLSNGRMLCEGRLRLACAPAWSPDERQVAMAVRWMEPDAPARCQIVATGSSHRALPSGIEVKELLVDDTGRVCAHILHDGLWDQPIIGGRAGTKVPLAWNLHHEQGGGVTWTTVHDDRLLTWTQRLHGQATANIWR